MIRVVVLSLLLSVHYSWASEDFLRTSNPISLNEEFWDLLLQNNNMDSSDEGDREPAGSYRRRRSHSRSSSSSRHRSGSRSGGRSRSYSGSGCNFRELSSNQKNIMRCLEKASVESDTFMSKLLRVKKSPGPRNTCAKYVAKASQDSGWTKGYPQGCTGAEKTSNILRSHSSFIDLVKYRSFGGLSSIKGVGALSSAGLSVSLMAPNGSIFSYHGNNSGSCGGRRYSVSRGGLGHMMAKVNNSTYCHFICNRCPALPSRSLDKVLVKVKSQYLPIFKKDNSLDSICNEINVVSSTHRSYRSTQ